MKAAGCSVKFCSEDSACVHTVCLGKVTGSLEGQDRALLEDIKDLSGFSPKNLLKLPYKLNLQVISFSVSLYISWSASGLKCL